MIVANSPSPGGSRTRLTGHRSNCSPAQYSGKASNFFAARMSLLARLESCPRLPAPPQPATRSTRKVVSGRCMAVKGSHGPAVTPCSRRQALDQVAHAPGVGHVLDLERPRLQRAVAEHAAGQALLERDDVERAEHHGRGSAAQDAVDEE